MQFTNRLFKFPFSFPFKCKIQQNYRYANKRSISATHSSNPSSSIWQPKAIHLARYSQWDDNHNLMNIFDSMRGVATAAAMCLPVNRNQNHCYPNKIEGPEPNDFHHQALFQNSTPNFGLSTRNGINKLGSTCDGRQSRIYRLSLFCTCRFRNGDNMTLDF